MIPSILTRLRTEPWALDGGRAAQLLNELRLAETGARVFTEPKCRLGGDVIGPVDWDGRPLIPQTQIVAGVAVIPVSGVLASGVSMWDYYFYDAYDYEWLAAFVAQALATPGVHAILIDWNSPGGSCVGCEESAAVLEAAAAQLPLAHFASALLCSAAYRLAVTGEILCAPSAVIGSIGAVAQLVDSSVAFANAGLKLELFTSDGAGGEAALKTTGSPGKPVDDSDRAFVRERVTQAAEIFRASIVTARPQAKGVAFQGGWVYGRDALTDGLVDALATREQAIAAVLA